MGGAVTWRPVGDARVARRGVARDPDGALNQSDVVTDHLGPRGGCGEGDDEERQEPETGQEAKAARVHGAVLSARSQSEVPSTPVILWLRSPRSM